MKQIDKALEKKFTRAEGEECESYKRLNAKW
jgi:hypothetical protein